VRTIAKMRRHRCTGIRCCFDLVGIGSGMSNADDDTTLHQLRYILWRRWVFGRNCNQLDLAVCSLLPLAKLFEVRGADMFAWMSAARPFLRRNVWPLYVFRWNSRFASIRRRSAPMILSFGPVMIVGKNLVTPVSNIFLIDTDIS
jgi:hypothetical protein